MENDKLYKKRLNYIMSNVEEPEKIRDIIIKNPPPEGVVLSLPLKGDENASCPQRGRGIVSGFI